MNFEEENEELEIKRTINNSVASDEQECSILMMRNENFATVYTSDTTYMTKLDKLCQTSPDMYSLIADTGRGKTYMVNDKSMISFRAKKREMTEEQKVAASERFSKLHAEGKIGKKKKGE